MKRDIVFTCGSRVCGHLWKQSEYKDLDRFLFEGKEKFADGLECPKCGGTEVYSTKI